MGSRPPHNTIIWSGPGVVPGCVARPLDLIPGLLPGVGSRRAPSPPGTAARPPAAAKRWSCSAITAAHMRAAQVGSCHRWPATSRASSGTDIPAVGSMSRAFLRPRRSLRPGAVSALRSLRDSVHAFIGNASPRDQRQLIGHSCLGHRWSACRSITGTYLGDAIADRPPGTVSGSICLLGDGLGGSRSARPLPLLRRSCWPRRPLYAHRSRT